MRSRRVIAILVGCVIGGVIAVIVLDPKPTPGLAVKQADLPSGQELADEQATDRHDRAVTRAVTAMHRAAMRGDRAALADAQRTLEQLARTEPTPPRTSTEKDPLRRAIDDFAFKRAPLFALQIRTTDGSHRVTVGVDRDAFCLITPAARLTAVRGAYTALERQLRSDGVSDLVFVVVVLTQREPTAKQELAIGQRGSVRLTPRGRSC